MGELTARSLAGEGRNQLEEAGRSVCGGGPSTRHPLALCSATRSLQSALYKSCSKSVAGASPCSCPGHQEPVPRGTLSARLINTLVKKIIN